MSHDCHNCKNFFDCDNLHDSFMLYIDEKIPDVEDFDGECFDFELSEEED